jgi:transposase
MPTIHPNARTTPAVRAEIARSREPTGILAQRYSVSTETIRKWRQRGPADCQDHSSRPHKLPWKATEEERAIVCALRRATGFPLDDLTFVVTHFLPHLNRDAVYRILKAEGLGRLAPASRARKPRPQAERDFQGVRSRLRAHGREAPAQAPRPGWRHAQALPLRRHRSCLPLRAPGRQGRRDGCLCGCLLRGSARGSPVPGYPRVD